MKMILYCVPRLGTAAGGGGLAALFELQALAALGHRLCVISLDRVSIPSQFQRITLTQPAWLHENIAIPGPPEFSRAYLHSQMRLISRTRKIRMLSPDLIVAQGVSAHRMLESFRSWNEIPRLMTLHSSPDQLSGIYHDGVDRLSRARREMATYDGLVQLGPIMAKTWAREPGLEQIPAHVIYNTIDEAEAGKVAGIDRQSLRATYGIPEDVFALTCVASLQYRKGQDVLLEALPSLVQKYPHLHLYLVGPTVMGWGGREILRQVERHTCSDHIHLVGSVAPAEALRWIKASDCFVLPSREEAMPLSILEAMYLGTPVIASDVNGIPDEVQDGVGGLLFSHADPEGLTQCIVQMISDVAFRERCVAHARARYDAVFTTKQYMARWADIVRSVLA